MGRSEFIDSDFWLKEDERSVGDDNEGGIDNDSKHLLDITMLTILNILCIFTH